MKRICYVIMVAVNFPAYHPKKGWPTGFENAILQQLKKHTIRGNYLLWKKRFEKIAKGEAYLSLRKWTGKPYASKQVEILQLDHSNGIGLEEVRFMSQDIQMPVVERNVEVTVNTLSLNDGLTPNDFKAWFGKPPKESMAIIHFTKFRYKPTIK